MYDIISVILNVISNAIAILFLLLCCIWVIKKILINKFATVKTIKAEVFDKYKTSAISKYPKAFKPESYIIVFKTENKKLSFAVSEYSYSNYRIKEKGTLKYKGNKIIEFR